jgi:ribosomal protein S18 acetylase RimI-like enzyme
MLERKKTDGYSRISLSVQKANYAVEMYRKAGFYVVSENEDEYIMAIQL